MNVLRKENLRLEGQNKDLEVSSEGLLYDASQQTDTKEKEKLNAQAAIQKNQIEANLISIANNERLAGQYEAQIR